MSRQQPDWPLIKRITRIVHNAPGGGLHRGELAALVDLPAYGDQFKTALGIACRLKRVDCIREYVVAPAPKAALCRVCKVPMDPVLPANGYMTHPCCDPDEVSRTWPDPGQEPRPPSPASAEPVLIADLATGRPP